MAIVIGLSSKGGILRRVVMRITETKNESSAITAWEASPPDSIAISLHRGEEGNCDRRRVSGS
jgi:hypothetical protein